MAKSLRAINRIWATWVAIVLVIAISMAGCSLHTKQAALKDALVSLNSAQDGFVAWDDEKQSDIVSGAETFEDGVAKLNEYHKKREPVLIGFSIAYEALAEASLDLTEANFVYALAKAKEIMQQVEQLTGKKFLPTKDK